MSLINELQNIGLSEKEAKVYISTLELAQASVQIIAQKAEVNRATTYVILDSLLKKGLVSTYDEGKKTYYIAVSPDALMGLFEVQKKEIEERRNHFEKLLPNLRLLHNRDEDKPVIRFFEGKRGLLNSSNELYSEVHNSDDARIVYSRDKIEEIFETEELKRHKQVRLQSKVDTKSIYNYEKGDIGDENHATRLRIPTSEFPISIDMTIYGDSVRIASLGKRLSAVLIRDHEIAKSLKSLFDLAWEAAKARNDKKGELS